MTSQPSNPDRTFQQALRHFESGQFQKARKALLELHAALPRALNVVRLLGASCSELGRHDEAIVHFQTVVHLQPNAADYFNLGKALHVGKHCDRALEAYDRGLRMTPGDPRLLQGRAATCLELGRIADAEAGFRAALTRDPRLTEAHANLGALLAHAGQHTEALAHFQAAIRLDPQHTLTLGELVRAQLQLSAWTGLDATVARVVEMAAAGCDVDPFTLLTISDRPEVHRTAARTRASRDAAGAPRDPLPPLAGEPADGRLRIAYVSADYRSHPVPRLIAGLLEAHDRAGFEIVAVSTGADDDSVMRRRIGAAVDRFVDVGVVPPATLARRLRDMGIHIAVDLMGHTARASVGAFGLRLAPVQVNFLGYPGTTGIAAMDYIVLDPFIATPGVRRNVTEKAVILPHCYQPNDRQRARPETAPTRAAYGLPERGFVYCCFNNTGKVTPAMFAAWMRILAEAGGGSVLWLMAADPSTVDNLRAEAARHGIAADRLVFADKLAHDDHLARYRVADLMLDTFPYGAHTTASDALWMGCPLVTLAGESFAARVAGSLLATVGLPHFAATTLADYERLAVALGSGSGALADARRHLDAHRLTTPLFDPERFARDLERAYLEMWRVRLRGGKPRDIDLSGPAR